MKNKSLKLGKGMKKAFAALALSTTKAVANSTCVFISHQGLGMISPANDLSGIYATMKIIISNVTPKISPIIKEEDTLNTYAII